jgi:hypothetical protein
MPFFPEFRFRVENEQYTGAGIAACSHIHAVSKYMSAVHEVVIFNVPYMCEPMLKVNPHSVFLTTSKVSLPAVIHIT